MTDQFMRDFQLDQEELDRDAPAGWFLAFNYSWNGPKHMYVGYPEAWRREYEEHDFGFGDPVLLWVMTHGRGFTRWSDIRIPDLRNLMPRAAERGLRYGAVFARQRSFLSVARSDREYLDDELMALNARFNGWVDLIINRATLTEGELDVLRAYRDGLGQTEAAHSLGISESAVKQRFIKACAKLHASTRTQAVAIALIRKYI